MASILVVGPHPDDQELGMGGTIALLASQGHRITLLDMTNGEPTPHGDEATRAREAAAAAELLSAPTNPVKRLMLGGQGLPNRYVQHTLEARHQVAGVIRAVQAQILFVPFPEDAHPDHRAVTRIVEDARFDAKLSKVQMPGDEGQPPLYPKWLFYYYATHLRWVADPSFIVDISGFEQHKREAVLAYRSQFVTNEANRKVIEWVHAAGVYFGSRIAAASGEPFFTKEPLGLRTLASLGF
ncbi:MAG: PIG-L family deacetylase [Phycisphaerales bacterium]|nr:PIG-L family deacetylase [Phycisphaerales bacterium]